jgi:cell division septal protein FtsQ
LYYCIIGISRRSGLALRRRKENRQRAGGVSPCADIELIEKPDSNFMVVIFLCILLTLCCCMLAFCYVFIIYVAYVISWQIRNLGER